MKNTQQNILFSDSQLILTQPCPINTISQPPQVYFITTYKVRINVLEPLSKRISCPTDFYHYARIIFDDLDADQEHIVLFSLAADKCVKAVKVLASGGMTAAIVDLRIVFRNALLTGAESIIIAHNHPSGNPEPSSEDISITKQMVEAGKMIGIHVLEHVIITKTGFTSLAERGYLQ